MLVQVAYCWHQSVADGNVQMLGLDPMYGHLAGVKMSGVD